MRIVGAKARLACGPFLVRLTGEKTVHYGLENFKEMNFPKKAVEKSFQKSWREV